VAQWDEGKKILKRFAEEEIAKIWELTPKGWNSTVKLAQVPQQKNIGLGKANRKINRMCLIHQMDG